MLKDFYSGACHMDAFHFYHFNMIPLLWLKRDFRVLFTTLCLGKGGGWKSTDERNNPTFTGYRKWFSEGKMPNMVQFMVSVAILEANGTFPRQHIDLCVCLKCAFMEELERFLSQRDVAELRRRELQHKRWTERVWIPIQRKVEEHVSSCSPVELKRRQSLYTHYIHHCNAKVTVIPPLSPALEAVNYPSCCYYRQVLPWCLIRCFSILYEPSHKCFPLCFAYYYKYRWNSH